MEDVLRLKQTRKEGIYELRYSHLLLRYKEGRFIFSQSKKRMKTFNPSGT